MIASNFRLRHSLTSFILSFGFRGSAFASRMIAQMLLPKSKGETIIRTRHGFDMVIDPSRGGGLEKCLYYYGSYEYGIMKLMESLLRKGDVMVDAGANIGLMSIQAASCVTGSGEVLAFEAHPQTFGLLERNIRLNHLTNVRLFQHALGSDNMVGRIYSNLHINRGGASLIKGESSSEYFDVEVLRFDNLYENLGIDEIRLVKVDVEGYELEVLKGFGSILSEKSAPILIVECSEQRRNFKSKASDLIDYIRGVNDYRLYRLRKGKERQSRLVEVGRNIPLHDNLICLLDVHLEQLDQSLFVRSSGIIPK